MKEECLWFQNAARGISNVALPPLTDVVVVGGGLAGLSCAWHLRRAGKRVVLLERDRIGHGASGQSLGVLSADLSQTYFEKEQSLDWNAMRRVHDALSYALDALEEMILREDLSCGWRRCPELLVGATPRLVLKVRNEYETRRRYDGRAQWMESADLHKEFPFLRARAAARFADQAVIDPYALCQALAHRIEKEGGTLCEDTLYLSSKRDADAFIVRTTRGSVRAKDICFCVDTAAHELLPEAPSTHALFQSIVATEPVPIVSGWKDGDILRNGYTLSDMARRLDGGRILFKAGQTLRFPGSADRLRAAALARVAWHDLFCVAPPVFSHIWHVPISFSKDALPFIAVREPGMYVAGSYGSNGLLFGFLAGELLCRMITHQPHPYQDIFTFPHPERLGQRFFPARRSRFIHQLVSQWRMDGLLHHDEHERLRG